MLNFRHIEAIRTTDNKPINLIKLHYLLFELHSMRPILTYETGLKLGIDTESCIFVPLSQTSTCMWSNYCMYCGNVQHLIT